MLFTNYIRLWMLFCGVVLPLVSGAQISRPVVFPEYPGGKEQLLYDFQEGLYLPEGKETLKTIIAASFLITEQGVSDSIWFQGNPDKEMAEAIENAIYLLKPWTPAVKSGVLVPAQVNVLLGVNEEVYQRKNKMEFKLAETAEAVLEFEAQVFAVNESGFGGYMREKPDEFLLGTAALLHEDYKKALDHLNRAYRGNPKSIDILYNRAVAKFQLGKLKQACIDWYRAQKLGDDQSARHVQEYCGDYY